MEYVSTKCNFSRCRNYRYSLQRAWAQREENSNQVLFIGLNPSTADSKSDDPTIRRCVNFASSWGFNAMEVVNLFSFRATYPRDLFEAELPIGSRNDFWINNAYKRSTLTIACWGSMGNYKNRSKKITNSLDNLFCIKKNKDGTPSHPLYLNSQSTPIPYLEYQCGS
ncbi:MAG: DUF1643 domain-containing protein [Pseudohongiellaceae bacterium]